MKSVLVIDDDPLFLDRLGRVLTGAEYRVLNVTDGDEALSVLDKHHREISLAIVDLVLPGTDGFQIIGAIERHHGAMKVIATTGRLRDSFLQTCKYMGANAVLKKPHPEEPFPAETWLKTISAVLAA